MCVCVLGLGEIKLNQLQSQYHWECQKELIGYRFESLRIWAGNMIIVNPKKYAEKMQFEKSCKLLFYLSGGMLLIF